MSYVACLVLIACVATVDAQTVGGGVSKSTYACNDPLTGKKFLEKYFPVATPEDECSNDVCECSASDSTPAWEIAQGRVYATTSSSLGGAPAGNGFGLHLVNVSEHWTTGGLSTAEVDAHFANKVGDMTTYDSFMDYSVVFATEGLAAYKTNFKKDNVKFLEGTWKTSNGTEYTSIIVHVQGQMILELCQQTSLARAHDEPRPVRLEQRVPTASLHAYEAAKFKSVQARASSSVGAIITPLAVSRAASKTAMAKLEDFYVSGMGTTMSFSSAEDGVTKKCFLWTGATMDVCYTYRDDSATKGSWKVSDFEDMLNTVHKNILDGYPFCGMDKWIDNHYAIDSRTADTSSIVSYIDNQKPYHYCESGGQGSSTTSVHYIIDPCGWGIQLDLRFSSSPSDCSSPENTRLFDSGNKNPVCTIDTSVCPSSLQENRIYV